MEVLERTESTHAHNALKTVLLEIRDWLPVPLAANFSSQMPLIIRGLFMKVGHPGQNARGNARPSVSLSPSPPPNVTHFSALRECRFQPASLLCQRVDDPGERIFCFGSHFIIRGILDRMWDEDIASAFHAKSTALKIGGFLELGRCDGDRWDSLDFKPDCVVQTARRTGTSIGQRFDDIVHVACNFATQVIWTRLGEGRLRIALHLNAGYRGRKLALKLIKQDIAAGLADVEQADRACEPPGSRRDLTRDRLSLVSGIKNCRHFPSFFCSPVF